MSLTVKKRHFTGIEPKPIEGVIECLVCDFDPKNPIGVHKLRPKDFVLIENYCKEHTSRKEITTAKWNECCGSFKGYEVIIIEDRYGKPYS